MNDELPSEIVEALNLLQEYEGSLSGPLKSKNVKEAFVILNDYLQENPESQYKPRIINIKKSYAKVILRETNNIKHLAKDVFVDYFLFAITPLVEDDDTVDIFKSSLPIIFP